MHVAAKYGHTEFLQMLAEFGANFHLRNGSAQAALGLFMYIYVYSNIYMSMRFVVT